MRATGFLIGGVVVLAAAAVMMAVRTGEKNAEAARAAEQQALAAREEAQEAATCLEHDLTSERRRAQRAEQEKTAALEKLETVQETVARLERELAEASAALAAQEPVVEGDWHTAVKSYPAYSPEGLGDALATVDWEVVADSMSHMPPLIAELAEHLEQGKPMTELPAETVGSIQQYNGPLVTTAMRLSQKGVVGTDVNGAFSHPGFMSNALSATLLALDMPLTKEQSAKLERITADYAAREAKRAAGYADDAYALEKIVDESRLKHAYFAAVYDVLTPEQNAALRPEAVRGRTQLDIFCESLVWSGKAGPMVFTDREDLARKVAGWALQRGRIPESQQDRARDLITVWVDELPESALAWEADGLSNMGMLHVENVEQSASHVLSLLKTFDRELDLDTAARASLRAVPGSIVLYHKPAQ